MNHPTAEELAFRRAHPEEFAAFKRQQEIDQARFEWLHNRITLLDYAALRYQARINQVWKP